VRRGKSRTNDRDRRSRMLEEEHRSLKHCGCVSPVASKLKVTGNILLGNTSTISVVDSAICTDVPVRVVWVLRIVLGKVVV